MPQPAKKSQSKSQNPQPWPVPTQTDPKMKVPKGGINSPKNISEPNRAKSKKR